MVEYQGNGEEEQLPRRQELVGLKAVRVPPGDNLACGAQAVQHVVSGVGEEVLMELKSGEEQLGAGGVQLLVQPRSVQLASIADPRSTWIAVAVPDLVVRTVRPDRALQLTNPGQLAFRRRQFVVDALERRAQILPDGQDAFDASFRVADSRLE